jgi:hypothetical protein
MAMTGRQTRPKKPLALGDQLLRGFDGLTLDPSPRLRRARSRLRTSGTFERAWRDVGKAIAEAVRSVGETISQP